MRRLFMVAVLATVPLIVGCGSGGEPSGNLSEFIESWDSGNSDDRSFSCEVFRGDLTLNTGTGPRALWDNARLGDNFEGLDFDDWHDFMKRQCTA